jgi:hypothetical protein
MSQVSVVEKTKMVDTYAQELVLHNLDIMAIISSYLQWKDVPNYLLVCKAWNKSFISRSWSMPEFLCLWKRYPVVPTYIKYVKHVTLLTTTHEVMELIRQTNIKSVTVDNIENPETLLLLNGMNLNEISIRFECQEPDFIYSEHDIDILQIFIQNHASSLLKLYMHVLSHDVFGDGFTIGNLPNLRHLITESEMIYYDDGPDLWDTYVDLRFLSTHCPNLEKLEIEYKYDNVTLEESVDDIEKLYRVLAQQNIKELRITDDENKLIQSSIFVTRLPILLQSRTLKYVYLELFCQKLGGECMFIRSIDPKICKIKIVGLQESYDVIEN